MSSGKGSGAPARPFIFVWQTALRAAELAATTKLVAFLLATYADADGRDAWPGAHRLATDAGWKIRAVRKHLAVLQREGWIVTVSRGGGRPGHATHYRLALPKGARGDTRVPTNTVFEQTERVHAETAKGAPTCTPPTHDQHITTSPPHPDLDDFLRALEPAFPNLKPSGAVKSSATKKLDEGWPPKALAAEVSQNIPERVASVNGLLNYRLQRVPAPTRTAQPKEVAFCERCGLIASLDCRCAA